MINQEVLMPVMYGGAYLGVYGATLAYYKVSTWKTKQNHKKMMETS